MQRLTAVPSFYSCAACRAKSRFQEYEWEKQQQKIKTLVNKEVLMFAMYLRNGRKKWVPRIGITV